MGCEWRPRTGYNIPEHHRAATGRRAPVSGLAELTHAIHFGRDQRKHADW
jgi:hypothetical protein